MNYKDLTPDELIALVEKQEAEIKKQRVEIIKREQEIKRLQKELKEKNKPKKSFKIISSKLPKVKGKQIKLGNFKMPTTKQKALKKLEKNKMVIPSAPSYLYVIEEYNELIESTFEFIVYPIFETYKLPTNELYEYLLQMQVPALTGPVPPVKRGQLVFFQVTLQYLYVWAGETLLEPDKFAKRLISTIENNSDLDRFFRTLILKLKNQFSKLGSKDGKVYAYLKENSPT